MLMFSGVDYVGYFNTISVISAFGPINPKETNIFFNIVLNYCRYSRSTESS